MHLVIGRCRVSTLLSYTGLLGELEHLKIKSRLIDEKSPSVMGNLDVNGESPLGQIYRDDNENYYVKAK